MSKQTRLSLIRKAHIALIASDSHTDVAPDTVEYRDRPAEISLDRGETRSGNPRDLAEIFAF